MKTGIIKLRVLSSTVEEHCLFKDVPCAPSNWIIREPWGQSSLGMAGAPPSDQRFPHAGHSVVGVSNQRSHLGSQPRSPPALPQSYRECGPAWGSPVQPPPLLQNEQPTQASCPSRDPYPDWNRTARPHTQDEHCVADIWGIMGKRCFRKHHYYVKKREVQFSCSVASNSLPPHGLQHARPPWPSPTPGAYSNSCLSSWWCHPTISSSVVPFSCPNPSQHQGLFQWVSSSHQVAKVLEFQLQHQSFQWTFRTDLL